MSETLLRLFDGGLDDARGILAVDRATFNDCPYSPGQVVRLLAAGEQRAWVAEVDGRVVGFVAAFPTRTLQAEGWEVDLLAVHPAHRGRGIGTALIEAAVEGASGRGATRARAAVAVKNRASRRAFGAAGFRARPGTCHLMRCDVAGATARPPLPGLEAIRPLAGEADAQALLRLAPALARTAGEVACLADAGSSTFLLAERDRRVVAFVELVKVQTLLYAGAWVEMLVVPALGYSPGSHPGGAVPLVAATVEWAKAEGLDEIGCLVPAQDWRLREAFVSEGFVSDGEYLVMVRSVMRDS